MGVEQSDASMLLAQASDLAGEHRMVRVEVKTPPACDFCRVWRSARAIQRFAVKGRGWA